MASRRKYMAYLSDSSIPVPKSTKYDQKSKKITRIENMEARIHLDQSMTPETIGIDSCSSVSFHPLDDYENLFHYQQKQIGIENEIEKTIELEDHMFESTGMADDLDTEDEELELKIDLNDDDAILSDIHTCNYFEPVTDGATVSFHDLAVLLITLKTTFNITSIALSFVLKIISLVVSKERRSKLLSIQQLYAYFHSQDMSMRKHYYCQNCEYYLGVIHTDSCPSCHRQDTNKYFVDIPMEAELQKVLARNWKYLGYRFERQRTPGDVSDVYDGDLYQKHFANNRFLHDRNNVSLLGNTDGVAIFKSSSFSVWPVYMVVNELPPKLRFRRENRILCGLWFGNSKPNFSTFFKPFTEIIWKLYTEGFEVTVPGLEPQTCKAFVLNMSCDSPAKCLFQDFMQFNAYYGCPYCLDPGEYDKDGHSHVYPYKEDSSCGFGEMRTHEGTVIHARIARENLEKGKRKFAEKGVKGISWAFSMPSFDIINSMCLDYMHAVLLGVMKMLIKFWCTSNEVYSLKKKKYEEAQSCLLSIAPPNNITRVPRSLDDRKHWKASEYRSFLLFYGPACLHKVLDQTYYDHFIHLSSAVWLLLQETISQTDLKTATRFLQYFVYQMSALYGTSAMTFSVHLLLHLPNTVQQNGPLWCHSCFFFEDYNSELRQFFHSSQHLDSQVVKAVSIVQKLPEMVEKMVPDSPGENLLRTMTADRYKTKCLTEVEEGICLVGQALTVNPTGLLQQSIFLVHDPFFDAEIKTYNRALIRGQMFHSVNYSKVSERNSYTVEITTGSEERVFGEILCFVLIDNSAYAFLKKINAQKLELCKDRTVGRPGQHLEIIENHRSEPVLVPLAFIREKWIMMNLPNLEYSMIAKFPNFIEKD